MKIINPANQEVIAQVPTAGEKEAEAAIARARQAFDQGAWPNLSLDQRRACLHKISQGILERAAELAKLETLNTGKPLKESTFMDVPSSAKTFSHFAEHLEEYLAEESLDLENARSRLVREPLGVAVLIAPWNYPLLIASWKLAQALAAGNVAILKPASLTPLTALELAKIIEAAGLPKDTLQVLMGSGEDIGRTLCQDSRVDLISFTGSNSSGKEVVQSSAHQVKKLILELGGKSAGIVLEDADLDLAVNGSLCSIFLNQGAMCTAMPRILVQEKIYAKFVQGFVEKTKRLKLGNGLDYETQIGPLISESHRQKVVAYVEEAKKQGAELLCGGKIPDCPELKRGFFFEPAVFTEVSPQAAIFKEEIFGPVACISKFSQPQEAIELANASDFGLAACIWSRDEARAQEIAKKLNSGTVWVNTYGMFYNEVPYGGFKQSGFGKELGKEGLRGYTRLKNIFLDQTRDARPLVHYWYGF
jgi:betaine-aldehyde dehydrogenase